ncbi:unnamed protein product [Allacma fusca]|uniref:Uncharacterized protein n=1 Tax=Allacma fusca TaxID=39272 RepID=A0A8J2K061_9HEXA|nr:unnamed protein product [Allacma fusca]
MREKTLGCYTDMKLKAVGLLRGNVRHGGGCILLLSSDDCQVGVCAKIAQSRTCLKNSIPVDISEPFIGGSLMLKISNVCI